MEFDDTPRCLDPDRQGPLPFPAPETMNGASDVSFLPNDVTTAAAIKPRWSRRQWLFAAAGSVAVAGWPFRHYAAAASASAPLPMPAAQGRLTFFTADEAAFVDAAIARLIPSDALGPGAVEAGVTTFIDDQLAGPFGQATDWYMAGPWTDGSLEQGYQSRRTPAEVYRAAIPAINRHSANSANKAFANLSSGQKDDLLLALEDGTLDLGDVSAKTFFTLLWENTQEGFFADPIYMGNRGFAGWKLIGYPGPRYNYGGAIRHFGQRYPLPTVGLMGRDPARRPVASL